MESLHNSHGAQRDLRGAQAASGIGALGPVALAGTLTVKWVKGRNGDFPVGDLRTAIGEFRVKDALLEQFDEGEYTGRFWVSQIYAKSYEYRGRITIETRANLADLQIDTEGDAPQDSGITGEPDPVDETPRSPEIPDSSPSAPVAQASVSGREQAPAAKTPPASPDRTPRADDADLVLFGQELLGQVREGGSVKLDASIGDRLRFRQQRERLKEMGYAFDVKRQTWQMPDTQEH